MTTEIPKQYDPAAAEAHVRERILGVVERVDGDADLLEVVAALQAGAGLADLLHGRQEESDEDGDDGDHHQKFDEREGIA